MRFSKRRLVPFGNLQRIPWAMLAITSGAGGRTSVSGHRGDRLHQDGRAEYSNVTNSESPVKGITGQVGRCEGGSNEDR